MAEITTERVAELSKDAAYVTIGLGVIAFQQAQVRRRAALAEIRKQAQRLEDQVESLQSSSETATASAKDAFGLLEEQVSNVVAAIERAVRSLSEVEVKTPDVRLPDVNISEVADAVSDRFTEAAKAGKAVAEDAYSQVISLVRRSRDEGAEVVETASEPEPAPTTARKATGKKSSAA
jgi:phage-related minor tail protein